MTTLSLTQMLLPAQPADDRVFIDIKNHRTLLSYMQNLQRHFMIASNFGLALDDEDRPAAKTEPAYLRNLFVSPHLSERHYDPEQLINFELQSQNQHWQDVVAVLKQHPRMFLLGDPGAGKSTILNWLMLALSYSGENLTKMQLGERVPFLLILRDLPLSQVRDWDTLWQVFLNRHLDDLTAPIQNHPELIKQLFESGQALFLIDGLDEVTEEKSRINLGKAVLEGINSYPRCIFLMTSRILGFDQQAWFGQKSKFDHSVNNDNGVTLQKNQLQLDVFETELLLKTLKKRSKNLEHLFHNFLEQNLDGFTLAVFYLAPFDLSQTRQFIENWYRQYLSTDHDLPRRISDLQKRLEANDGLGRLARIPVLLNMICFIHSRRGRLPDGRAELYQRIAETYLTALDRARGLKFLGREFNYDYLDLSEWLGKLALQLQDKRSAEDQALLIEKPQILTLLRAELQAKGMAEGQITDEIDFILRYLAERSGLFIPRGLTDQGIEQYGFTHLSFLEYFAAYALLQEVQLDSTCLESRRATTQLASWHECWALFFEQIEHSRLTEKYLGQIFSDPEEDYQILSFLNTELTTSKLLCAKIVMDSAVRLGVQVRHKRLANLWLDYLKADNLLKQLSRDYQSLCEVLWSERFESKKIFMRQIQQSKINVLLLSGEAIADLKLINELPIKELNLLNSNLTGDWTNINSSTLKTLALENIAISDLSVLKRFKTLNLLKLEQLAIKDLTPLMALKELDCLELSSCPNIDFNTIAKLTQIKILSINGQTIGDASSLAKLKHLEQLTLMNLRIDNFAVLGACKMLSRLNIVDAESLDWTSLTEIKSLKSLSLFMISENITSQLQPIESLESLDIISNAISDITWLSGFINLTDLDLRITKVNDIRSLKSLKKLKNLYLPAKDIKGVELFDKNILHFANK